jgi:hypothetical protein
MKHLKKYVKPEMQTYLLQSSHSLLAGSATPVFDTVADPSADAMAPEGIFEIGPDGTTLFDL